MTDPELVPADSVRYSTRGHPDWILADDHNREVFELRRQLWEMACEAALNGTAVMVLCDAAMQLGSSSVS